MLNIGCSQDKFTRKKPNGQQHDNSLSRSFRDKQKVGGQVDKWATDGTCDNNAKRKQHRPGHYARRGIAIFDLLFDLKRGNRLINPEENNECHLTANKEDGRIDITHIAVKGKSFFENESDGQVVSGLQCSNR